MTITTNDVKLLKSQRLTDEDDGGGRAASGRQDQQPVPKHPQVGAGRNEAQHDLFQSSALSNSVVTRLIRPRFEILATKYSSDIKLKSAACTFVAACAFLYRKSDKVHVFPVTREEPRLHPPV